MKKMFLLLVAFTVIGMASNSAFSQVNIVRGNFGYLALINGNGSAHQGGFGATYERATSERMTVGGTFQYIIGDLDMVWIAPEGRFNFNETFNGPYVGMFVGYGFVTGGPGVFYGVGPQGGYELALTDNLTIDVNVKMGYGMMRQKIDFGFGSTTITANMFHINPGIGVGYSF